MNTFDERKKAFEAKFLQDEDLKFKLRARRNKKQLSGHQNQLEKLMMKIILKKFESQI